MAAFDHVHGVVLGQVDVAAKTNEIPMFATLLDRIDIAGAIITADAMHAQRTHAQYLVGRRGAHYVLTVKRNQPHLHTLLTALPWREVPVADDTRDRGHGRTEWRTVKVTAVAAGLGFPHAAQAIRIIRRRRPLFQPRARWDRATSRLPERAEPHHRVTTHRRPVLRARSSRRERTHLPRPARRLPVVLQQRCLPSVAALDRPARGRRVVVLTPVPMGVHPIADSGRRRSCDSSGCV